MGWGTAAEKEMFPSVELKKYLRDGGVAFAVEGRGAEAGEGG